MNTTSLCRFYVYDGENVVLKSVRYDSNPLTMSDLKVRFLGGPAVDSVFADECFASHSTPDDVL